MWLQYMLSSFLRNSFVICELISYLQSLAMQKVKNWLQTVKSIVKYPSILMNLNRSDSSIYFFFPFYHTGGAERVHLDILNSVKDLKPTCFITDRSVNNDFKEDYIKNSKLIELFRWGKKKSFRKHIAKKIALKINQTPNAVIFGCNSSLFYDVLPLLNKNTKKIDMIHAFIGDNSFEQLSLPLIPLIDYRIILGPRHLSKLKSYYLKNNIDLEYLKKINIIPNQVEVPLNVLEKNFSQNLRILFIARDSPEKRIHLFLKIAQKSEELNLPFEFTMIGDLENYQPHLSKNIKFVSRIRSKSLLNFQYAQAHFIMLTSSYEGFPMVLLEGMALGTIPIITDVGEVSTLINENRNTGFIIENSTDQEIISAFVEKLMFITNHRELLPTISQNVIETIKKFFNKELFKKNYRDLLMPKNNFNND